MNPYYNMLNGGAFQGGGTPSPFSFSQPRQSMTPIQIMQYFLQAMTNPAAFMKQQFPDIPNNISNNPAQIFNYLQQTHSPVSNQQVQQAQHQAQQIMGNGTVK